MKEIKLTCICCPMGCPLTVAMEGGEVTSVSGNTCQRGDKYARKEVVSPTRVVTTTVRLCGGGVVPCKTASDIPKGKIMEIIRELANVEVCTPVAIGQVILPNAAGTGVDVVATKTVAVR